MGGALFQVVTKQPIAWETNPEPYTLIGDFNEPPPAGTGRWTDYSVTADLAVGAVPGPPPPKALMERCSGTLDFLYDML